MIFGVEYNMITRGMIGVFDLKNTLMIEGEGTQESPYNIVSAIGDVDN